MSAIRSSSLGTFAASLSAFTASIWFRPMEAGRLQYILAAGVDSSATPLFAIRQTAADDIEVVGSATQTIATGIEIGRLHHIMLSHDGTNLYWRVSSIIELSSGTAAWASPNLTTANRLAIGSRHDADTAMLDGELYRVYMIRSNLGDARSASVLGRFEKPSTDQFRAGYPTTFAPRRPAQGSLPDIYFGGSQQSAQWAAGTNRGSMMFAGATGTAVADTGLGRLLTTSTSIEYGAFAYATDGTYVYVVNSLEGSVKRAPANDLASMTTLMTLADMATFKDSGGTPIGSDARASALHFAADGSALLTVINYSTKFTFMYRSADVTTWGSSEKDPVLLVGGDEAQTSHKYEIRALNTHSFLNGTFNGNPAVYFVEYNISPETGSGPADAFTDWVWYSTDSGATWAPFWKANPFNGPRKFRHGHGITQLADGQIVCFFGDLGAESALIRGTSTAVWSDIHEKTHAEIKSIRGASYLLEDTTDNRYVAIQSSQKNGWLFFGSEGSSTNGVGIAIWAVNSDFSTTVRTYRNRNHIPGLWGGPGALSNGAHVEWGGVFFAIDYLFPYVAGVCTADYMEVQSSRDGWFWVPCGRINMESAVAVTGEGAAYWNFIANDKWVLGGPYTNYMAGTKATLVVSKAGWTGARDSAPVLNI